VFGTQAEEVTDVLSSHGKNHGKESRRLSDSDFRVLIFRIQLGRSARLAIRPALDEAGFSALPMKMLVGMD